MEGSALFLDVAGLTDIADQNDPETVVAFVNELYSEMIAIALKNGGTVERYLGDVIMVVWGAPDGAALP